MTEEEQRQIDVLLNRAKERMRKKQTSNQFLFRECQCQIVRQNPERNSLPKSCMADMNVFLEMVCGFCREHGCCRCSETEGEDEDELPF